MDLPEDAQALGTVGEIHVAYEDVDAVGERDRIADGSRRADEREVARTFDRGHDRCEDHGMVVDEPDAYRPLGDRPFVDVHPSPDRAA